MRLYDIVLFVHLAALFAAFGATAVVAVAMRRIRSAVTGAEALPWLALGKHAAHIFPAALLTLLASGAYMVHRAWSWDRGFVVAGLAGIVFLGVVGDRVEGGRARRLAHALAADPQALVAEHAAGLVQDPVWWTAALVNPAVALAVAFDMATKPSVAAAFAVLAVGAALGAALAVPLWRRPAAAPAVPAE